MIHHNWIIDLNTLRQAVIALGFEEQEILSIRVDGKDPIIKVNPGHPDWEQETIKGYQVSSRHGVKVVWKIPLHGVKAVN